MQTLTHIFSYVTSCFMTTYCKIPIKSPGTIFVQKAVFLGLFSGKLIFKGAYYRRKFCVSKWVDLNYKNRSKHYDNILIHGLIFGRAYYRKDICVFFIDLFIYLFFFWGGVIFETYFFFGGGKVMIEFYGNTR